MSGERILKEATFAPTVVKYHVLSMAVVLGVTIVLIPLLAIVLPITAWYHRKHYSRLRVTLTARDLKVHRGILVREEKTIPLEKITDLAVFEGPVMRRLGLKGIRVETAGQTGGPTGLVRVIGIEDTDGFRDQVLRQRDRIADTGDEVAAGPAGPAGLAGAAGARASRDDEVLATLRSIDLTLRRIEAALTAPDRPPAA